LKNRLIVVVHRLTGNDFTMGFKSSTIFEKVYWTH